MTNMERWKTIYDFVVFDDEGEIIGVSESAPEEIKALYNEIKAEEAEVNDSCKFATKNIIFDGEFRVVGVRENAPADTMAKYNAFVEKYGSFPPPCED